jgi:hypothetical protein
MVGHSNDEEMISSRAPASRLAASKATRSTDPTVGTREPSTATGWSIDAPIVPRSAVPSRRRGTLDQALQTRLDRGCGGMSQRFQTDPVSGRTVRLLHGWRRILVRLAGPAADDGTCPSDCLLHWMADQVRLLVSAHRADGRALHDGDAGIVNAPGQPHQPADGGRGSWEAR